MFTLNFDGSNNFCPVDAKYGTSGDRKKVANTVCWMINNAQASIHESYTEGAPRRVEMDQLCDNLRKQLASQLTQDEAEDLHLGDYWEEPLDHDTETLILMGR